MPEAAATVEVKTAIAMRYLNNEAPAAELARTTGFDYRLVRRWVSWVRRKLPLRDKQGRPRLLDHHSDTCIRLYLGSHQGVDAATLQRLVLREYAASYKRMHHIDAADDGADLERYKMANRSMRNYTKRYLAVVGRV
jgi:phage terminase Nu1 subunit (DNA packaging protein)